MYGITLDPVVFEETAIFAHGLIGNEDFRIKCRSVDVHPCEHWVEVPCDLDAIISVTRAGEDY